MYECMCAPATSVTQISEHLTIIGGQTEVKGRIHWSEKSVDELSVRIDVHVEETGTSGQAGHQHHLTHQRVHKARPDGDANVSDGQNKV